MVPVTLQEYFCLVVEVLVYFSLMAYGNAKEIDKANLFDIRK